VLAATNLDLQKAVAEGRFREDLYFRLGVITIALPPLREREGDLILLANAFLHRYVQETRKKINGFTQQAVRAMSQYAWPGNIREWKTESSGPWLWLMEPRSIHWTWNWKQLRVNITALPERGP